MSPALLLALGLIRIPLPPTKVIVPPPPPVVGVVVDEQGRPVVGVQLFRTGSLLNIRAAEPIVWHGKTDDQGRFSIDRTNGVTEGPVPDSDYEVLIAIHRGRRPTWQRLPSWITPMDQAALRIELRPATSLPIRVLAPDGTPVAGARVQLPVPGIPWFAPTKLDEFLVATTGADGRASLALVEPAEGTSCHITSAQFGAQSVAWSHRDEAEKVLTLRATGRLSGRVTADDPAAVRQVHVSGLAVMPDANGRIAHDAGRGLFHAVTDLNGRFDVPALAVGRVSAYTTPPEPYVVVARNAETTVEIGKPAEAKLTLERGITVRGVLREQGSGRPIVHALVRARHSTSRVLSNRHSARTNDDGRFEFFLQPGPVELSLIYAGPYVFVDGPTQHLGTIPEGVESYELPPVELVRAVDLRVLVRDPDGRPVAGASVEAVFADGQRIPSASLGRQPLTNAQGELTLWPLPPDRKIELCASLDDAASGPPAPVLSDALKPATLVLSMQNTMSLSGRVVDEYGKPVADAAISFSSRRRTSLGQDVNRWPLGFDFAGTGNLRTDADGRFQTPRRLRRFEAVKVSVRAPGMRRAETDWFAPTTPSLFDITLYRVPPPEQAQIRADYDTGYASFQQRDYAKAETHFQAAVAEAEKRRVREPLDLAWWLNGLADARQSLGKNDSAEALARHVLELRAQALFPTHPDLAEAHCRLGSILQDQGKLDDAEAHFRKALDIHQRAAGTISPGYAHVLAQVGSLELAQDRNKEAEADLARADSIVETIRGPESNERVWGLEKRGIALWRLDRLPEAESVYRQTLTLLEKAYGPAHAETARVRKELAQLVRARTRAEAGEGRPEAERDQR